MFFDSRNEIKELAKLKGPFNTVSYGFCKRLFKKAQNESHTLKQIFTNSCFEFYETDFDYTAKDKYLIYISNEQLAEAIYEVFSNSPILPEQFSSLLGSMQIIACEKKKKAYFIVLDSDANESISGSYYTHILVYFYDTVTTFCNLFSNNNIQMGINYEVFFDELLNDSKYKATSFIKSLFYSVIVGQSNFPKESLVSTINSFINLQDYGSLHLANIYEFDKLSQEVLTSNGEFYSFVRNGVYVKDLDVLGFYIFPLFIYLNLLKLAVNFDTFTDPLDFFKPNVSQEKMSELSKCEAENFIFDEQLFENLLSNPSQTESFTAYSANIALSNWLFLKFNNYSDVDYIESLIFSLSQNSLVEKFDCLDSLSKDECYLFQKTSVSISLKEKLSKLDSMNGAALLDIIQKVHSTFYGLTDTTNNLYFKPNEDILEYITLSRKTSSKPRLCNIQNLVFNKEQQNIPFNYALLIMRILEYFLKNNSLGAEDIFSYEFAKMLPAKFIEEFNSYFSTGSCDTNRALNSLENLLNSDYLSKIVFLEDIQNNDTELIKRISFFGAVEINEEIANLLDIRQTLLDARAPNIPGGTYVNLDEFLTKAHSLLTLNDNNIQSVLESNYCLKKTLGISKIIISKSFINLKNYQIIGVIWNHSDLYNAFVLAHDNVINTQQIYSIIAHQLQYNPEVVRKICNHSYSLLVDDNLHSFINGKGNKTSFTLTDTFNEISSNYSALINSFKKVRNSFECFEFTDLIPYDRHYTYHSSDLLKTIKDFCFCKEHQCYYLPKLNCPKCLETYIFFDRHWDTAVYSDSISKIEEYDDEYMIIIPSISHSKLFDQVKLGMANSLYDNFFGFEPDKIVMSANLSNKFTNAHPIGIAFDCFDFEGAMYSKFYKNVQRLKFVTVLYRELLPHIQDGSFICNDEAIFSTIFMHSKYKGKIIIPNLYLLDSEAILSTDENLKANKKQETLTLFSKFLIDYLLEDDYLKALKEKESTVFTDVLKDIEQLGFNNSVIKKCVDYNDNYCFVHKVPFSTTEKLCPHCRLDGIQEDNIIIKNSSYFERLASQTPKFDGGEANLYDYSGTEVQKIFKEGADLAFKSKLIGKVFEKAHLFEEFNSRHDDIKFVPIKKLLYCNSVNNKNGVVLKGYVEDLVDGSFKISALKDKEFVANLGYTTKNVVEILMKVCIGIEFLHSIGGFIGDLNGGNILIKDKVVYFIDFDGMSFDDAKNCVYTNMYIYPPSAEQNNITQLDDWYSLAVQAFYYLTYSHPFRGTCDDPDVPKDAMERMKQGKSVLGRHGIKVPSINTGWHHFPKPLVRYFLDTFEGSKRESMLNVLQLFLSSLPQSEMSFTEIKRISEVRYSLTENTYIDYDLRLLNKEQYITTIENTGSDIAIYDDCILFNGSDTTSVLNNKNGKFYTFNKTYETYPLYVQDNRIFYTRDSGYSLMMDKLNANGDVVTRAIERTTSNKVLSLMVNFADKFLFVEENETSNTLDIYGNLTLLHSIPLYDYDDISILYDRLSDRWLVLFVTSNFTNGVVIDKKDSCIEFTLDTRVSDSKQFYGNVLYYATNGKICYYNINTKRENFIACHVARENSKIERDSNKFIVSNKDSSWIYLRT